MYRENHIWTKEFLVLGLSSNPMQCTLYLSFACRVKEWLVHTESNLPPPCLAALAATKQNTRPEGGKEAAAWCQARQRAERFRAGSSYSFAPACICSSASVREEFRATDDHQRLDATMPPASIESSSKQPGGRAWESIPRFASQFTLEQKLAPDS